MGGAKRGVNSSFSRFRAQDMKSMWMRRRLWQKPCMKTEKSLYFFMVKDHSKPDRSNKDSDQ